MKEGIWVVSGGALLLFGIIAGLLYFMKRQIPRIHRERLMRKLKALPPLDDSAFLAGCGILEGTTDAKLALAVRKALAEMFTLPRRQISPELRWQEFKPRFKLWSYGDCLRYMNEVQKEFGREFSAEIDRYLLFPVDGIPPQTAVKDFVADFVEVYDRYERVKEYLPSPGPGIVAAETDAASQIRRLLESCLVFLQGGTAETRRRLLNEVTGWCDGEYSVFRLPSKIEDEQGYWDAMHKLFPMLPRYEVDGNSGLDMEEAYYNRIDHLCELPRKVLFVWEEAASSDLFEIMGVLLADAYETALRRKPEKIRFLVSSPQPLDDYYRDNTFFYPPGLDEIEFAKRVMILLDLSKNAGKEFTA